MAQDTAPENAMIVGFFVRFGDVYLEQTVQLGDSVIEQKRNALLRTLLENFAAKVEAHMDELEASS